MNADDERLARALRELRRRSGMSQEAAAAAAGVSPRVFRRIEQHGSIGSTVAVLRSMFAVFDARVDVSVMWRGAELDRLLDRDHAAIVEMVVALLGRRRWRTAAEVTFSVWGERGSIDVFGFEQRYRACVVGEVKSAWGSLEETNRRLDVKVRLAPKLGQDRFGARPATISRLLILPDEMTLRRVAEQHAATLKAIYPARGREIRTWLRKPDHAISGLWFVSNRTSSSGDGQPLGT